MTYWSHHWAYPAEDGHSSHDYGASLHLPTTAPSMQPFASKIRRVSGRNHGCKSRHQILPYYLKLRRTSDQRAAANRAHDVAGVLAAKIGAVGSSSSCSNILAASLRSQRASCPIFARAHRGSLEPLLRLQRRSKGYQKLAGILRSKHDRYEVWRLIKVRTALGPTSASRFSRTATTIVATCCPKRSQRAKLGRARGAGRDRLSARAQALDQAESRFKSS